MAWKYKYDKYQQGDVLLQKVDEETFKKDWNASFKVSHDKFDSRMVLREGEGTGHAHAIYLEDMLEEAGVKMCKHSEYAMTYSGLIVTGAPVNLKHEEHDTIALDPGHYFIKRVREYDPISGRTRGVID